MTLDQWTSVFAWMTVINIGIYAFAALFIVFARDWVANLQARITRVPAEEWPGYFIDYLSRFKIVIIVFNLTPYLALRIVG